MGDNSKVKDEVTETCAHSQAPYPNVFILEPGSERHSRNWGPLYTQMEALLAGDIYCQYYLVQEFQRCSKDQLPRPVLLMSTFIFDRESNQVFDNNANACSP
jgi:hypothetical protein